MKPREAMGRLLFWLTWPGLFIWLPRTRRARVLVVSGHRILLVRSWLSAGAWHLPGGGQKSGETPRLAAQRELFQETSLQVSKKALHTLGNSWQRHAGLTTKYTVFWTTINKPRARCSSEIIDCIWADPKKLPTNCEPQVREVLAVWQQETGLLK